MKKVAINGFGVIGMILVIAGLAIISGGAWYYRSQIQRSAGLASEATTSLEGQQVAQSNGAVEKTGWNIYKNEAYGFEIKYPEYLVANLNFKTNPIYEAYRGEGFIDGASASDGEYGSREVSQSLYIVIKKNDKFDSVDKLFKEYSSIEPDFGTPFDVKKMRNMSGITYEEKGGDSGSRSAIILHDAILIHISEVSYAVRPTESHFDEIISSLKFTK